VLYPEATDDACTAAVLLDVDPVRMVRSRGRKDGGEDQGDDFPAAPREMAAPERPSRADCAPIVRVLPGDLQRLRNQSWHSECF